MKDRPIRRQYRRKTASAVLTATAVLAALLVGVSTGVSSAAPVSSTVPVRCSGADKDTLATLALAKGLIGSDTIDVSLLANSKADIPANAGIGDAINATFDWKGTLAQPLIDKAAELSLALKITNIKTQLLVKGPSTEDTFSSTGPDANVAPVKGAPSILSLGTIGGPIETTGGGIITYRVGAVSLTASLALKGQAFVLNLKCAPTGSNLIAKTTVKDPDAPTFTPDVVKLKTNAGETVSVDLLNGVISEGKTPLIPGSLKIVENPAAGTASITDGVFSFTAPQAGGTYSTTVEICGEPKAESGIPGVSEIQKLELGSNWSSDGILAPRPVAFTLKFGDQETKLIWTAQHNLLPGLVTMPLKDGSPTPDNWAPQNKTGLVNAYAMQTHYKRPSAATIQASLEALPGIGAGNVVVTELKEQASNPNKLTGFKVAFQGALAEQDVPEISLGQWYSVPPQELLDRISEAVAGLAGGGETDPGAPPAFDFEAAAGIKDTDSAGQKAAKADKYIGDRILQGIQGGKAVSQDEWDGWVKVRLINPIMDQVPAIVAWLTSLFPEKIMTSTEVAGEAPTPPQDLCAQGIIEVTVQGTEVEPETLGRPDSVAPAPDRMVKLAG